jgi:hypothetical protein
LLFLLGFVSFSRIQAQSNATAWGSVFVNGPFKGKWGLHLDAQVRSGEQMDRLKTWLFRPGLQYQVNKRNQLSIGYAYVKSRLLGTDLRAFQPEHRIWQQWIHHQPIGPFSLQHRIRTEQRFIGAVNYPSATGTPATDIYATRLRYFNRMILPFVRPRPFEQGFFGALQNEVFLHLTGKEKLNGNVFDQNRLYAALGYRTNKTWDAEIGYMRRDIRATTQLNLQHTWQLAIYLRPE